jgi:hypothetical protein
LLAEVGEDEYRLAVISGLRGSFFFFGLLRVGSGNVDDGGLVF